MIYWEINQTDPLYFDKFYKLNLGLQQEILKRWLTVAGYENLNPTPSFMMTTCTEVGPNYYLVNFDDLELEFLIEVLHDKKVIKLISFDKPTKIDYHQHD